MIRFFDILISIIVLALVFPFCIIIIFVLYIELKSPIFSQKRLGRNKKIFVLRKFRTMKIGTPSLGTHNVSVNAVTKSGVFLRKTKLDELPQLLNVLRGEMSLVGPRPCLSGQIDVISERDKRNIFSVKPGITGLSQIRSIDMSVPELLATTDELMINNLGIKMYFSLLIRTALGKGQGDQIRKII